MLKIWNFVLILLAFLFTIFGTFITRSGLVSSVHSFAQSNIGPFFSIFLTFLGVSAFGLLFYRLSSLKNDQTFDGLVSRETSFLFNNLVLLGIVFTIFWGTIFPMISEMVQGVRISIGPPFFNQVVVPMGLLLMLLMGIGPLLAWRRTSLSMLSRQFFSPVLMALVVSVLLYGRGIRSFWPLFSFTLIAFVFATIIQEFYRGIKVVQETQKQTAGKAFLTMIFKNRRRYGGYFVHVGILLIFVGLTGNAFNLEKEVRVATGEAFDVSGYHLTYQDFQHYPMRERYVIQTTLAVDQQGKYLRNLYPAKYLYPRVQQPMTEVVIHSTLREDLYVILAGFEKDGRAIFKVFVLPLVKWIWIGGVVIILSSILLLFPEAWVRRWLPT